MDSHNATGLDAGGEGDKPKLSVLKKVKAKAKKIKDTLKPHSHGTNGNEGEGHEATPDDDDMDEEGGDDDMDEEGGDDEDDEIIHHDQDPQRRAPLVAVPSAGESARSYNEGEPKGSAAAAATAGKPISSGAVKELAERASVPSGPFSSGTGSGLPSPVLEDDAGRKLKEDPPAPKDKSDHDYSPSNNEAKVTDPTASGGDAGVSQIYPHAPKDKSDHDYSPSNNEAKVTDPTASGGDAGVSQILKSMDKMNIYDDKEAAKREFPSAGSHDQFSPAPNKDIKATAQTAKPASMTVEYGKKIAATVAGKLSPAYDKVVGVGASAVSRVQGGTTETDERGIVNDKDKGGSVKEYFAKKLRPGEEDRALSQVISEVLHKQQKVGEEAEAETREGEVVNPAAAAAAPAIGGKSVVDKLKGAVGYNSAAPPAGAAAPADAAAAAPAIGGKSVVDKLKGAVGYNSAAPPAGAAAPADAAAAPAIGGKSVVDKLKGAVGYNSATPPAAAPADADADAAPAIGGKSVVDKLKGAVGYNSAAPPAGAAAPADAAAAPAIGGKSVVDKLKDTVGNPIQSGGTNADYNSAAPPADAAAAPAIGGKSVVDKLKDAVVNPIPSAGTNADYNSAAAPANAAAAPAIGGKSVVDKLKDSVGSWFGKPQPNLSNPMPSSTVAGATREFSDSREIGEEDAAAAGGGEARAAN